MTSTILLAPSAPAKLTVGALAPFATTWLSQTYQLLSAARTGAAKREALYADFIAEATKHLVG